MSAPVARPVASSGVARITWIYANSGVNLPLTNYTKLSSKCLLAT
jgi:hypothetical protein